MTPRKPRIPGDTFTASDLVEQETHRKALESMTSTPEEIIKAVRDWQAAGAAMNLDDARTVLAFCGYYKVPAGFDDPKGVKLLNDSWWLDGCFEVWDDDASIQRYLDANRCLGVLAPALEGLEAIIFIPSSMFVSLGFARGTFSAIGPTFEAALVSAAAKAVMRE